MASLGDISRPEAVDAVEEYAVDERGQRKQAPVAVAQAEPAATPSAKAPAAPVAAPASVTAAKGTPAKAETIKPALANAKGKAGIVAASAQPAAPAPAAVAPAPASSGALGAIGSLFGSKSEAGVASASAAPAKAGEGEGRPFYKRWLGVGSDEQASAPEMSEPAMPQPIKAPLPPRRQAKAPDAPPQRQASLQQ
jgi:pyruvate dehydrogenase E2 component (dihydrolipoamide acetyltransferase)